jgi:hypothetical protein
MAKMMNNLEFLKRQGHKEAILFPFPLLSDENLSI